MSTPTEITDALAREKIIPDIVPEDYFTPSILFAVVWPTGAETILGNKLRRPLLLDEPDIQITPLTTPSSTKYYTLVMTDPDAPSRTDPKYTRWRHWVIPGLQCPSAQLGPPEIPFALKTRPAVTPYWPPGPAPGSGVHRYTFLLFEEPGDGVVIPHDAIEYGETLEKRRSWNPITFAEQYGLKLVGANYFLCQAEE